ncbi:dCTP deaminase domain-containing protein [Psychromonas sp. PT13]|uniref:dCTP deaminase domain-containing protein n=1 Tax=Psychromonas sp. PT13 TaxID=3439547 RepID=UPI003EBB04AE
MLSQIDIVKALGNSINIFPFKENNLKENSYNLTASRYAYASKDSDVERYKIKKGKSCVVSKSGVEQIVLLPHSTTLMITEEVIGVTSIGGTYHSKVGLASIGFGHIGTMLGPHFCGHSLIAVHNISDEIKHINVGDTFASIVFHKLDTPIIGQNATVNAHLDKFSSFGILEDISKISEDWKTRVNEISDRMKQSGSYKTFKKKIWRYRISAAKSYLNIGNVIVLVLMLSIFLSPNILVFLSKHQYIEAQTVTSYHSFFYNIALSGVGVFLFQGLYSLLKRK